MTLKKVYHIINILIFTYSCATTESIISDGKLYTGMSKESLRNILLDVYPGEDPFITDHLVNMTFLLKRNNFRFQ